MAVQSVRKTVSHFFELRPEVVQCHHRRRDRLVLISLALADDEQASLFFLRECVRGQQRAQNECEDVGLASHYDGLRLAVIPLPVGPLQYSSLPSPEISTMAMSRSALRDPRSKGLYPALARDCNRIPVTSQDACRLAG